MRRPFTAAVALGALLAGVSGISSAGATTQRPATVLRLTMTGRIGNANYARSITRTIDAPGLNGADPTTISVPRRAVVTFTVSRKTAPFFVATSLPTSVGAYYAYYLPQLGYGEALLADPGSPERWPAQLDLSGPATSSTDEMLPGLEYWMLVAVNQPGTVPMPFPLHVHSIRAEAFSVAVVDAPISMLLPAEPATFASTDDLLGRLPVSATAIGIDLAENRAPISQSGGRACPTASGWMRCSPGSTGSFFSDTQSFGPSSAEQIIYGQDYAHPVSAPKITGYIYALPYPFKAAALFGFSLQPDLSRRVGPQRRLGAGRKFK